MMTPTFTTHLRDAAFHARNAARSLDRAAGLAQTEEMFCRMAEALRLADLLERECREAGRSVGSGAR